MADKQEDYLIQKVILIRDGKEAASFDLSFLKSATLIETMDLSGPRLMMTFDDPHSIIRDDMGVRTRDALKIRIADAWARDGTDQTIMFTVWTMPNAGNIVTLNCMQADVDRLKQPAKQAILFTKKPVETILKKLAPGLKYDVGAFPVADNAHLLPGERPTRLLRQMAAEKGAVCFYRRGTLVFRKLAQDLAVQKVEYSYEYDNPAAANQIVHYTRLNTKAVLQDRVNRHLIGWHMVDGVIKSGKKTQDPPEYVSVSSLAALRNLVEMPYPAIDYTALGNGQLMPGIPLALKWNTAKLDAPIDESLPEQVIIGTVAHHYATQKYLCRVKGVLPL